MIIEHYEIKDIRQGTETEVAGASGALYKNGIEIGRVVDYGDSGPLDIRIPEQELTELKLFALQEWPTVEEYLEYLIDKAVN